MVRVASQRRTSQYDRVFLAQHSKQRQYSYRCIYPKKKSIFCLFRIKVLSRLVVALNPWVTLELPQEPAVKIRSYTAVLGVLLGHCLKTTNLLEQVWWPDSFRPLKMWTFPSCTSRSSVSWPVPMRCLLLQLPSGFRFSSHYRHCNLAIFPKRNSKTTSLHTDEGCDFSLTDFCFWTGQHLFTVFVHLLVK